MIGILPGHEIRLTTAVVGRFLTPDLDKCEQTIPMLGKMLRTSWVIIIHPDHTLLVSSDDCHLPIGKKEIRSGDTYTPHILGENDEFIWVLLQCANALVSRKG